MGLCILPAGMDFRRREPPEIGPKGSFLNRLYARRIQVSTKRGKAVEKQFANMKAESEMPMNKKATLLLLEYMKRTIEQMPNDVKINRFFMWSGEAGIILDSGIYDAARALNKKVDGKEAIFCRGWSIHTMNLGALTVYEPRKQLRFSKEWEEKI